MTHGVVDKYFESTPRLAYAISPYVLFQAIDFRIMYDHRWDFAPLDRAVYSECGLCND